MRTLLIISVGLTLCIWTVPGSAVELCESNGKGKTAVDVGPTSKAVPEPPEMPGGVHEPLQCKGQQKNSPKPWAFACE